MGTAHSRSQREPIREYSYRFISWTAAMAALRATEEELRARWSLQVAVSQREGPKLISKVLCIARGPGVAVERIFLLKSLLELGSRRWLSRAAPPFPPSRPG
jgi:hypothetical protein